MVAAVLVVATAVAETEGEGGGVGVFPKRVRASAIEQRQVKSVVFIGIFRSEMHPKPVLDSEKTRSQGTRPPRLHGGPGRQIVSPKSR